MTRKKSLKKIRCPKCGRLVASLLDGSCSRCTRLESAFRSSSWETKVLLVQRFGWPEGPSVVVEIERLVVLKALSLRHTKVVWQVSSAGKKLGPPHDDLGAALAHAETYGRTWLEKQP